MIPRHSCRPPLLALALLAAAPAALADGAVGYYQFPALRGDELVFAAEGDLWKVSAAGGLALRLTTHDGIERFPHFSPDGKWLAFAGEYQGNMDVYVMPAAGGEPHRLTYHPDRDEPVGWRPDSQGVLFRSRRASPNYDYSIYEITLDGATERRLPIGVAALAAISPDGGQIAFNRTTLEFRTWKRYRGGTADDIWVGNADGSSFRRITDFDGDDRFPMWHDGRVYFISDRSGRMNVWSVKPDGQDPQQHTRHTDYDVRWPTLSGGRIVYMLGADLWLLDLGGGQTRKLDITLASDRLRHRPRYENAARTLESYALSDDGKRIVIASRGELWTTSVKPGRVVALTQSSGVRERDASFSPDGKQVAYITDQTGEQELAIIAADGKTPGRVLTRAGRGWIFTPEWSPDGKRLAYADLTMTLFVVDAESGASVEVDRSEAAEIREYAFSPDGKWLAYTKAEPNTFTSVYVYNVEDRTRTTVSTGFTNDANPAWDPEGKYLYFLSARSFNPHLDELDFQYATAGSTKVCVTVLARDGKSPFLPDELLDEEKKTDADKDDKSSESQPATAPTTTSTSASAPASQPDGEKKPKLPDVKLDVDGLAQRVVEAPIDADNYVGLHAVKGKLFYSVLPLSGLNDETDWTQPDAAARAVLHGFDLKKKKDEVFLDKVRDYTFSRDGEKIAWRTGDEIMVAGAGAKPGPDADDRDKINPATFSLPVDPAEEWAQIFAEAWRLQRDFYWDERMAGIDWPAMRARYEPFVSRVSTRQELNDLLGELIGELGTSHTYIFGGDLERARPIGVGLLGADIERTPQGLHQITRVLRPELWETDVDSPLSAPHAHVQDGEFLFAINGRDLAPTDNVFARLENLAGKQVLLTVGAQADRSDARDVQVEALSGERELRYRDWRRRNREYVAQKSAGRIGYLHLPDMGGDGLTAFIDGFYAQLDKDALLVDARYNGGGFVSQMMIERLARRVDAYDKPRRGKLSRYPYRVHVGPKVCLVNQQSGSDGDIFPAMFQKRGLGPVIGVRTWGGVIGIRADKRFIDGGLSTQPEFAWFDPSKGGWTLENRGVEPDIEVDIRPEDWVAGRDPQLDRGIEELEKELKANPPKKPEILPAPNKAGP